MLVKIVNGEIKKCPYSLKEFRVEHKNTSFPKDISTEVLESYGIYAVKNTTPPNIDDKTQTCDWSVSLVDGQYTQVWETQQRPEEEAALNLRFYRDNLLMDSDWTQIADAPVDQAAWATYRQALRDLPSQEGFPYSVTWPVAPS